MRDIGAKAADCSDWNTMEFFEMATAAEVRDRLDRGADPNARNEVHGTPLHLAAALTNNLAIIAALLDAGADPATRNGYGLTPLHLAAGFAASPAVVRALLAVSDIDVLDELGWTPLHHAVRFNKSPAAGQALLDAGADPTVPDWNDMLPFDLIQENSPLVGTDLHQKLKEVRRSSNP